MVNGEAFRFVDLFAGLGGFHVALEDLGGECVFAAEWKSQLNALYLENFGIQPWGDINELDSDASILKHVPDHEVLTAGFPCQPFSKAGEQLGFTDTLQGQLFFKVFDVLRVKRPDYFILENVPNILKHNDGKTLETIVSMLEKELGYHVQVSRLSPHQFGVPQIRERAYFVGSIKGLDEFKFPQPSGETTDIRSVLDTELEQVREIPKQTLRVIDMWNDFLRRSGSVRLPSFPIWSMEFGATYPYRDLTPPGIWRLSGSQGLFGARGSFGKALSGLSEAEQFAALPSHSRRSGDDSFPRWKQAFIRQNREFYSDNREWIDPWLRLWKPWQFPSSFQKFEWNAQGGPRNIDMYVLQVRASGVRVKRTNTAPSLVAMTHTQVPILGAGLAGHRRYMAPKECAALQSLGDIVLPTDDLSAYKALGNAVNARVVGLIAKALFANPDSNMKEPSETGIAA